MIRFLGLFLGFFASIACFADETGSVSLHSELSGEEYVEPSRIQAIFLSHKNEKSVLATAKRFARNTAQAYFDGNMKDIATSIQILEALERLEAGAHGSAEWRRIFARFFAVGTLVAPALALSTNVSLPEAGIASAASMILGTLNQINSETLAQRHQMYRDINNKIWEVLNHELPHMEWSGSRPMSESFRLGVGVSKTCNPHFQ